MVSDCSICRPKSQQLAGKGGTLVWSGLTIGTRCTHHDYNSPWLKMICLYFFMCKFSIWGSVLRICWDPFSKSMWKQPRYHPTPEQSPMTHQQGCSSRLQPIVGEYCHYRILQNTIDIFAINFHKPELDIYKLLNPLSWSQLTMGLHDLSIAIPSSRGSRVPPAPMRWSHARRPRVGAIASLARAVEWQCHHWSQHYHGY